MEKSGEIGHSKFECCKKLPKNSHHGKRQGVDLRDWRNKERFNGVGLLKDYELKLNIDDSVRPEAHPVRRIPFGARERVERKLDELLATGIIEGCLKDQQGGFQHLWSFQSLTEISGFVLT